VNEVGVRAIPGLKIETWGTRFLWWVEGAKSNRNSLDSSLRRIAQDDKLPQIRRPAQGLAFDFPDSQAG